MSTLVEQQKHSIIKILGVKIDDVSFESTLERLMLWADGDRARTVITPNPEIILQANRDFEYRAILNAADLSLPDGYGLRLVSKLRHTVTGADVAAQLLKTLRGKRITLVVRRDGRSAVAEVQAAAEKLATHCLVQVVASSQKWSSEQGSELAAAVARTDPDVVLVGLGFPYQEQWLIRQADCIPTAKILMAVGGTFDFWTGIATRAPAALRTLHLEWLWRVVRQPRRIGRIWRAVVVFPLTVLASSKAGG